MQSLRQEQSPGGGETRLVHCPSDNQFVVDQKIRLLILLRLLQELEFDFLVLLKPERTADIINEPAVASLVLVGELALEYRFLDPEFRRTGMKETPADDIKTRFRSAKNVHCQSAVVLFF